MHRVHSAAGGSPVAARHAATPALSGTAVGVPTTTVDPSPTPSSTPPADTEPDRPRVSLGYIAGLDGLRALGLLVMLAYHHGVGAARGGIFTVSMFFTLSGYLIATLALVEWSREGRLSLARFWERRARRLLPAAIVTVVAVVGLQHWFEVGASPRFRGDLLAALGYVANWRYAYTDGDYGAIFALESPVQHFWSLAVEEQFYLVFPLAFAGLARLSRGRWRLMGTVFGVTAVASFAAAWVAAGRHGNSGLAYYAAYTRASEILVGVTLAFVLVTRPARDFLASRLGTRLTRIGAVTGLLGLAWLWHTVSLSDPVVFRGATALNAALTGLVIVACVHPAPGRAARALGLWPLRNLGKISYAVYLFHWPLFLLLDADRTGLSYWPLFGLRVATSIVLAIASYHLLEARFRFRHRMSPRRLTTVLALPAAVVAVLVVMVPVHRTDTIELAVDEGSDPFRPDVIVPEEGPGTGTRVLLMGDSVSWTMWPGLATWNEQHPDHRLHLDALRAMGCPLGEPAPTRFLGRSNEPWPSCEAFRSRLVDALEANRYDVVVVVMGHKDLGEREIDGHWTHFGDPAFDEWFRDQVDEVADLLTVEGTAVLWSTVTPMRATPSDRPVHWSELEDNDPARVERQNQIIREALADRPGFEVLDTAEWLRGRPGGPFSSEYRSDGVHWTFTGSDEVAAWTVPHILAAAPAHQ